MENIKLTIGDINILNDTLTSFSDEVFDYETSVWLFNLAKQIQKDLSLWDDYKNTIINKYAEKNEDTLMIPKDKFENYKNDLEVYLLKDVDVTLNKISINNFKTKKIQFQFLIATRNLLINDTVKTNTEEVSIDKNTMFNIISIIKNINILLPFDLAVKIANIANKIDLQNLNETPENIFLNKSDFLTKTDLEELKLPFSSFYLIQPIIENQ